MMSWSPWTARVGGEIDCGEGVTTKNGRGRKVMKKRCQKRFLILENNEH